MAPRICKRKRVQADLSPTLTEIGNADDKAKICVCAAISQTDDQRKVQLMSQCLTLRKGPDVKDHPHPLRRLPSTNRGREEIRRRHRTSDLRTACHHILLSPTKQGAEWYVKHLVTSGSLTPLISTVKLLHCIWQQRWPISSAYGSHHFLLQSPMTNHV